MLAVLAPGTPWQPLSQQFVEADTLFLLDPAGDSAAGRTPGFGGLVQVRDSTPPTVAAGKFRQAIAPTAGQGYYWMPAAGALGASEFTIEGWFKTSADWSTLAQTNLPFSVGNAQNTFLKFVLNSGGTSIAVVFSHTQNPASPSAYSVQASATITAGQCPANTWVNLAATLKSGKLTLYLNGSQVAQTTGVVAPSVWGAHERDEGVTFGGLTGAANTTWAISDVRISRRARTPNRTASALERSTVTVSATTTGKTVQKLIGAVNQLGTNETGTTQAEATQLAQRGIQTFRTDKMITASPIKAGGTDATHPTLGHSGAYSYDWQVVDRTIAYITGMGCEPYISIDANATIFGGSVAPFSGTNLTTKRSGSSPYSPGPPNNPTEYAKVATDLVNRIINELGVSVPYWGVWNEPDGAPNDWEAGAFAVSDWLSMYGPLAISVKALAPGLKIGGPELGGWINNGGATWIKPLIYYCGTLPAPTGVAASAQAGGYSGTRTFNGAQAWFYKAVYRNGAGNSVGSNEVSATPATGGSVQISLPTLAGATTADIYAATTSGGQNGATSLLASGVPLSSGTVTFTDTGQTLTTGAIPSSATASGVPLDFVSWHYYQADIGEFAQVAAQVPAWASAAGITTPELVVSEGCWQSGNEGYWPWWQPIRNGNDPGPDAPANYFLNDWHAAFLAASLIQMQANGVTRFHLFDYIVLVSGSPGGLYFDSNSVPQSNYNVGRLWAMMQGFQVLSVTVDADPGVFTVACKDPGSGKVYVFLASLHYQKTQTYPALIDVSALKPDGTAVTAYLVDDGHSNAYDAGSANAALTTSSTSVSRLGANVVADGQVGINLRPRAAALLVVG